MNNSGKEISKIAQIANLLSVRQMRGAGLGTAEYDLLRLVKQQPGISQKDACAQLDMDKGALARRAVNLEQKGYLTRRSNPKDARSQLLFPEPKADQMDDAGDSAEDAFYGWLLEGLSEEERGQFCEALRILEERARKESEDGFPNVNVKPGLARSVAEREERPAAAEVSGAQPLSGTKKKKTADTQLPSAQDESDPKPEKRSRRQDPDVWLL